MGGGLMVAAAALQMGGNIYGSLEQKRYYDTLANQNRKQAIQTLNLADMEQRLIYDKAAQESEQVQQALSQTIGTQRAVLGASNLAASKTAEDIRRSSVEQEYQDQLAIKYNADLSAWKTMTSAQIQAEKLREQAKMYNKAGKQALVQGGLSLLSTATSFLGKGSNR